MKFLIFFIILIAYKFLSNLSKYLRIKKLYKNYILWLTNENKQDDFEFYTNEVLQLFKNAGITDSRIPMIQSVGYGKIVQTTISIFDNLTHPNIHIVAHVKVNFLEAIGVYKKRCIDSFKFFYWIEMIIWLPKTIVNYLGLSSENIFTKITQLFWWIITPLVLFFREQLFDWLQSIFSI